MGLFSFIKPKVEIAVKLVIYLDAGRGNARSAVVEMRNGVPHILYTILGEQRIGDTESSKKGSHTVPLGSFEEILEQIAKLLQKTSANKNKYVAEEVYCILAAPYYLSHTSIINYKGEKPVLVSQSFIRDLLEANQKKLSTTHTDSNIGSSRRILHEKIISIKINGYNSNNPYNKMAEEVQVAVFRTEVDLELYKNISRIIKKFTPAPSNIEPLSLASFIALRNRLDAKEDFVFITVGNEVTEVSLVKDHTLLETTSFPFGKYSLARSLAQKIGQPSDIALSKIRFYHDKKLHVDEMSKLKSIIDETQAEWFSYLEKTLVALSEEMALPDQVYLVVDTDLKDVFENIITEKSFASQALVPNGFSIHTLDTAKFADCCTFGLNIRFDTLLAVGASFAGAAKEAVAKIYPMR